MATRPGRDLTQGPIARTLLLFALPTLGSSILQSLNGSINAIWVGQFLGEAALAATANANLVMFLMFSAVFGFGMAATILIGQRIGAHDVDGARRVIGTTIGMFAVAASLVALAGWLWAPSLLHLLATPPEVFGLALAYLRIIFLGLPPSMIVVLITMGLRGSGDSLTPLWFMILSAVIDVILNPVLILGLGPAPQLGIRGSAAATLIANIVGLLALVAYIYRRDLPLRLRGREIGYLLPDLRLLKTIVFKGVPMGLQMLVVSVSALAMIGLVNREGAAVTAAYGAANQLWTYIQMPAMALGAAVSAMAAQNIGANRWDRVSQVTRAGIGMNVLMTGSAVLLLLAIDRHALSLFLGNDGHAMAIARHMNLIVSWGFILFGITSVLSAVVRANGAVMVPLLILVIAFFPVRLGLAASFQPRIGADAIWWSYNAGSLTTLVLTIAYFRFGGWRALRMMPPTDPIEAEEMVISSTDPAGRAQPNG
ncbi:MATE family efflux transporter [Edaphosphingomonas haloaromaticamans]|uniref:Multidrug export protein MepA n=1 Tax=Edaphosphingomonas haloaromaticamans TaxID=653954 RepID=A0A1S1HF96_9SPHN|nr:MULTISPECIES: MATE family efflux transporter [Sphingomonas]MDX3883989.1 MATE family efflux transporter [Sphingomonas sp.]OHT19863.1 Multidrug export protein MepA [Sphingomonas haloaromaticamans]